MFHVDPEPPRNISITNITTTALYVNVDHGTGKVQSFYIQQNNEGYILRSSAAQNVSRTNFVIPNLIPGKLYDTLQIYSESYGLNSTSIPIAPHSTG